MPSSGIEISPEMGGQWNTLRLDQSINYIVITIQNMEKFSIVQSGYSANPAQQVQEIFQDKEPGYALIRQNADKFYIVFYCPLGSKNALKMVYSSSLNALKSGLGTDYLCSEIYATSKAEVTTSTLEKSTVAYDRVAIMTQQEQLQLDAAYSTVGNLESESKMTADLPVKVSAAAKSAIDALNSRSVSVIGLTLNITTEELEVSFQSNDTPEQVQSKLKSNEPAYVFFNYSHINPQTQAQETAGVFIYYCPLATPIKSKMFHSSAKAPVIKVFELYGLKKQAGFEADAPTEFTTQHLMDSIHPPSQQVTRLAKPVPPHLRRKQQQQ